MKSSKFSEAQIIKILSEQNQTKKAASQFVERPFFRIHCNTFEDDLKFLKPTVLVPQNL
jgi:hypothetical protein